MPEIAGPLQSIEPLRALPFLVLVPLVACVVLGSLGPWLSRRGLGRAIAERLGIGNLAVTFIALGASLSTLAVAVHAALRLASLAPERRFFYAHLWPVVRRGSVHVDLGLSLDPLSTALATMIAAIGVVAHLWGARSEPDDATYPWSFASLQLFVFSALLVVVAADLVTTLVGWQTLSVASWLLLRKRRARRDGPSPASRAFVVHAFGDAAFVVGILLLLWGLGGSWLEGGAYQPDNLPGLAAVRSEQRRGPATGEHRAGDVATEPGSNGVAPALPDEPSASSAWLGMSTHVGARVYLDDAAAPLATSPFSRLAVAPGDHVLRVATPGARDEELAFDARSGTENVVMATGPTLSYRELYDRMALTDVRGRHVYETDFTTRMLGGKVALGTAICLLFLLAAAAKCGCVPFFVGAVDAMSKGAPLSGFLQATVTSAAGVYLLARLGPLFASSATAATVLAFTGSATALIAALTSIFQRDIRRVLACLAASQVGLVFLGLGAGAHGPSLLHLMANAVAQACLWLAAGALLRTHATRDHDEAPVGDLHDMGGRRRREPASAWLYALGAATLSAAPLPLLLGFASKNAILWRALESRQLGSGAREVAFAMALAASVVAAWSIWRSYFLAFEGQPGAATVSSSPEAGGDPMSSEPALARGWLFVFLPACLAGGVLLASPRASLDTWLAPVLQRAHFAFDDLGAEREQAATVVAFVASLAAFFWARGRYGKRRRADWGARERDVPFADAMRHAFYLDRLTGAVIERPLGRIERVLSDIDDWVIEGWTSAIAFGIRAVAAGSLAIDRLVFDGGGPMATDDGLAAEGAARRVSIVRMVSYLVALLLGASLALSARLLLR